MKAPKDVKNKQKVFVINGVNQPCLKLIFKAFKLNQEMLMEMSLKQLYTKIVPYTHKKYRDEIVREETKLNNEKEGTKAMKYWFMNLAYRWTKNIEEMECVKIIYDM